LGGSWKVIGPAKTPW